MRAELYETGTMDQLERLHIQVQIEALKSQKLAAAAIVKNSRYMLMSVVMATIARRQSPRQDLSSISSALPASFAKRIDISPTLHSSPALRTALLRCTLARYISAAAIRDRSSLDA
jgi:outer membrane protein TolC